MADKPTGAAETPALTEADPKNTRFFEVTTADERRDSVRREYGTYIATEPITMPNGALAFNPGDPVPVSHVEGPEDDKGKRDAGKAVVRADQVAKRGTVEARAAVLAAGGIVEE